MASLTWKAYFGGFGIELTGLTQVDVSVGKQLRTDPYPVDSVTVRFVKISSWSVLPTIGDAFVLRPDESPFTDYTFKGYIKDVQYEYGIVSAEDTCTIVCEGLMALLGRRTLNAFTTTQARTLKQIEEICTEVGVTTYILGGNGRSLATTQTYSGNALDLVNELIVTESGFMKEYSNFYVDAEIILIARNELPYPVGTGLSGSVPVIFSDDGSFNARTLWFDQITFRSAAENYYTQVVVEPQGLTRQVASSGTKPYRGLTIQTLDSTTTQADDLAEYLLNMYSNKTGYPTSLTVSYERQDNATRRDVFLGMITDGNFVATRGRIVFRGTTYNVIIEGANISADVDGRTTATFFFTSEAMNNFLLLNDDVYGTLDSNRLGF